MTVRITTFTQTKFFFCILCPIPNYLFHPNHNSNLLHFTSISI